MTYNRDEIVRALVAELLDTPSLTIAKILFRDHKAAFNTLETARTAVRRVRGQNGKHHRKHIKDKALFKSPGSVDPFSIIPEGWSSPDDWKPIDIDSEKVLRICDAHVPYHIASTIRAALKYGKQESIDTIILDDFIDFYQLSHWEKDPEKRSFARELDVVHQVFGIIRNEFPDVKIILKKGNHEFRYDRYMRIKAPELIGVKDFAFQKVIKAKKYEVDVIDDKRILKMGELFIVHGHEFGRSISTPVNPARGLYLRAKYNAICGHFHKSSYHNERSIDGKVIGTWSVGCACDLHPEYLPINSWNNGFAVIYRTGTKSFRVHNKTFFDGEIY